MITVHAARQRMKNMNIFHLSTTQFGQIKEVLQMT